MRTQVGQLPGMGEYSFADFESHERLFRVTSAVIDEAPGKPCGFDDYNPSAELSDGSFLVRREESCGMFTAYSVSVGADPAVSLLGEDPGLFDLGNGDVLARTVVPEWPEWMNAENFDINGAARLHTVWRIGRSLGALQILGEAEGKGFVPVPLLQGGLGCYQRPQDLTDIRTVSMAYIEMGSAHQLFDPATLARAARIGGGIFRSGTGGGPNGAWDTGDGTHNLTLFHYARDLDTTVPQGCPKAAEYCAAMGLHNRITGQFFPLGRIATRADWGDTPSKYPGRENIVYPSALFNVSIGEQGIVRGAARAGLSDAAHGKFEFESTMPYDQLVSTVYNR